MLPNSNQGFAETAFIQVSEESNVLLTGLEKQVAEYRLSVLEQRNKLSQEIAQHQLTQAELHLIRQVMENASQAVVITDANNIIIEINEAYTKMTGFDREIAVGSKPSIGKSGRHDKAFYQKMWKALTTNNHWEGEVWDRRADGSIYPKYLRIKRLLNGAGEVVKYVAVFEDLTYKKETEKELEKLIHYDHLTGLSNQTLFRHHLEHEFEVSKRHSYNVALLLINLDRFREINESFGYVIGDELIKEVALRLEGMVRKTDLVAIAKEDKSRPPDTLARLGGNEFSITLSELDKPENASVVARRIMTIMEEPFNIQGEEIHICISMGISTYPENATDLDGIILCAEKAINEVRKNGGQNFQFYSEQTNKTSIDRYLLETKLRKALDKQEFFISYQPKIDLSNQKIMGMEALIRWQQEDGTIISPVDFIPLAEDTGLILPIGEWVFRQACLDTQALTEQFNFPFKIAVNLSARQFQHEKVERLTQKILDETGLPAAQLELEITESMVMNNVEKSIATMNKLNDMGVSLAIDDFGTGYSSLAYLKKFPVQTLKIDKAFVYELEKNSDDAAIVATICSMGHQLGLSLVAEGIETEQQMNFLNEQKCQYGQGYYLSRPIPLADLVEYIKTTDEIFGAGSTEHYLPIINKITNEDEPNIFQDYFPNLEKHFHCTNVPIGDFFINPSSDITDFVEEQPSMQNINQELEFCVQQRIKKLESTVTTLHNALGESKKLHEKLLQQAIRDPLTGLYNRRYMEEYLEKELGRAIRYQHKLCIVFLDIDNFKLINDSFGHKVGDAAMREISQLVQGVIRSVDVVCRYGGDELILILPETTLENALDKCEELRNYVCKTQWGEFSKELVNLTISLGVAEFPSHGDSRDVILNSADLALLRAKKNGRNLVVSA